MVINPQSLSNLVFFIAHLWTSWKRPSEAGRFLWIQIGWYSGMGGMGTHKSPLETCTITPSFSIPSIINQNYWFPNSFAQVDLPSGINLYLQPPGHIFLCPWFIYSVFLIWWLWMQVALIYFPLFIYYIKKTLKPPLGAVMWDVASCVSCALLITRDVRSSHRSLGENAPPHPPPPLLLLPALPRPCAVSAGRSLCAVPSLRGCFSRCAGIRRGCGAVRRSDLLPSPWSEPGEKRDSRDITGRDFSFFNCPSMGDSGTGAGSALAGSCDIGWREPRSIFALLKMLRWDAFSFASRRTERVLPLSF